MKAIEIQSRWTGAVLYSGEHESVKEAVEALAFAKRLLKDQAGEKL